MPLSLLSSPNTSQVESLLAKGENLHEGFRLFITAEPHPAFPIGLLQVRGLRVRQRPLLPGRHLAAWCKRAACL